MFASLDINQPVIHGMTQYSIPMNFKIRTIREDNYLAPSSMQAVKGGVAMPECTKNLCTKNSGTCGENECEINTDPCEINKCGTNCELHNEVCRALSCTANVCKLLSVGG